MQYLKHLRLTDEDEWARLHVTASDNHQVSCSHPLEFIGGVDISFVKGDHVNACAALVVVQLPSLEVSESAYNLHSYIFHWNQFKDEHQRNHIVIVDQVLR